MLRALKLQASKSVAGDVEILQTLKVALFLMGSPHVDIQEQIKTAEPEGTQSSDRCLSASRYQGSDKPNMTQTLPSQRCVSLSSLCSVRWCVSGRRCVLRYSSVFRTQNTYTPSIYPHEKQHTPVQITCSVLLSVSIRSLSACDLGCPSYCDREVSDWTMAKVLAEYYAIGIIMAYGRPHNDLEHICIICFDKQDVNFLLILKPNFKIY